MASAHTFERAADRLWQLVDRLEAAEGFDAAMASLHAGHGATLDGVWGSSCALIAAALARRSPGPLIVVCPHPSDVDDLCDEFALFSAAPAWRFPAWDALPLDRPADAAQAVADDVWGERLRLIKALPTLNTGIVVASIAALLQPVPSAAVLAAATRRLAVGATLDVEELAKFLVEGGFHRTTAVELPGEFSRRGGIVDLFAADWDEPVRLEFFDDKLESIRRFEPATQRSLESLAAVDLTALFPSAADRSHVVDAIPRATWRLLVEPTDLEEEGNRYVERSERPDLLHGVRGTIDRLCSGPTAAAAGISTASLDATCRLKIESVERFSGEVAKVRQELEAVGYANDVYVVCQTEAEVTRLTELFHETRLATEGRLHFAVGRLREGFRLVAERIAVVSGAEMFHRADLVRSSRKRLGRVIDSFLELRDGDLVVHVAHGIGKYRGLKMLDRERQAEEHLELEFHGGTKIYVPASKIELVQKYVGGSKARPTLARVGGKAWVRQKAAAESAVVDLAAEMLDLQAARASRPGIAFPADTDWQREFDAAFPYVETPDQLTAIAAVKADMQGARPMDRLICGDVGYGKTEVAMRAAFKAVDAGYQTAVLAPTTILAEQHGRSFRERMAEYPFQIRVLSRFCSTKEEREILAGMADGSIDIVVGTHRLAQADISFKNLGLIVIDEEQRFGVAVKERLKTFRTITDVLTLTATPIPRTLHMSLLGLRDISNLETPPAERLAVETRVTRYDPEMIRHAILRELNRQGQIFFVHNRIHDIVLLASELGRIVPEARIGIAHGQMAEGELENVMLGFVRHEFDMLLATTIIESGLDIPNANTIFIDEADRYGLADLHQLRGRVGRYKRRAHCYLLLHPERHLAPAAQRRLRAIQEFSDMGAGFAIAMRDLEIRGGGNILGPEQSGHIAAVGYEMYCDLLEKTVRKLKQLPPKISVEANIDLPGEAYFPKRYVPDVRLKLDLYRRLNRIAAFDELTELKVELVDRFGPLPEPAQRLLDRMELRLWAHRWDVVSMRREDQFAVLEYRSLPQIETLAKLAGKRLRIVDGTTAYWLLDPKTTTADDICSELLRLFQSEQSPYVTTSLAGVARPRS